MIKNKGKLLRSYAKDVRAIAQMICHMAFVKRHCSAAWVMLCLFPTLVKLRRTKIKPEHISPFVYVMQ